ncbi:MFS transporter [Paraburkholderia sp. D1E]|uniref:MFS transporter n=1 Tax=Paraburkholderia sp. D1E TaxID=3461398 RepID=UPI0040461583
MVKSTDVPSALGPTIVAKQPSGSLCWLALGTFSVGTEGFMIAALLPTIAADLSVKVATAGHLVTIFALAYAVSSPILTAALGGVDRRRLLIFSLAAFAVANLVAARVHSFWTLVGARILLALAAGLYVPGASALASALVTPERRGRALAIVNGRITIAIALGVPIGALVGERFGWRMTFVAVAALSALATIALKLRLPVHIGAWLHTATLRERLVVVRQPVVAWLPPWQFQRRTAEPKFADPRASVDRLCVLDVGDRESCQRRTGRWVDHARLSRTPTCNSATRRTGRGGLAGEGGTQSRRVERAHVGHLAPNVGVVRFPLIAARFTAIGPAASRLGVEHG